MVFEKFFFFAYKAGFPQGDINDRNLLLEALQKKPPILNKFVLCLIEIDEIISSIEKGEAEGILAWHPDRLARNSVDGGRIIYLLDRGIIKDLKFPTYRLDNNAQGKFMLSIAFGQSKYYIDALSENIRRSIRLKLSKGIWP